MNHAVQLLEVEFEKINEILANDDLNKMNGKRIMSNFMRSDWINRLEQIHESLIILNRAA